jgi:hypothetical protein
MGHDVFVSHASHDRVAADAILARLEAAGVRCWIAPRDILPGRTWGGAIMRAITGSRMMLLVFSSRANTSPQILREVERAVSHGLVVVTIRIEDVRPSDDLEYFLSSQQWLDAFPSPVDPHLDRICTLVRRVLAESAREDRPVPTTDDEAPELPAIHHSIPPQSSSVSRTARGVVHAARGRPIGLVILPVVVVGMIAYAVASGGADRTVEGEVAEQDSTSSGGGAAGAVGRAASLIQAGDTTGAITEYESALRQDPDNYAAEFYLGLIAFQRQQTNDAVRHWRRVVQILEQVPTDTSVQVMEGRTETRGNTLNALVLASAQYLNLQQPQRAAELLAELTPLLPNNPEAWYNYSLALNNLQRWQELVPSAQRTTEIAPLSYGSWVLFYNGYAGQSQAASQAGNAGQAKELGDRARELSRHLESLPLQLESVTIDVEAQTTLVHGTAVGTGRTAPVTVEFTLHGAGGPLGRGTVTIAPPASRDSSRWELSIPNAAPVLGVTYRVVGT